MVKDTHLSPYMINQSSDEAETSRQPWSRIQPDGIDGSEAARLSFITVCTRRERIRREAESMPLRITTVSRHSARRAITERSQRQQRRHPTDIERAAVVNGPAKNTVKTKNGLQLRVSYLSGPRLCEAPFDRENHGRQSAAGAGGDGKRHWLSGTQNKVRKNKNGV